MVFFDRHEAGQKLAEALKDYRGESPYIIALPRGGVVVGYEVARALSAPLDLVVARKLGVPHQPELGFGAIAPYNIRVLNPDLVDIMNLDEADIEHVTQKEQREMERRLTLYRGERPFPDLTDRVVIVVDDGLATGMTALAAIKCIKTMQPKRIILAVPVGSPETIKMLSPHVDEVICITAPPDFMAVGTWYRYFDQVSDREVMALLQQSREWTLTS